MAIGSIGGTAHTWAIVRSRRPLRADEATTLRGFLGYHRDTLRMKCSGLRQAQLTQPLPPSDMTLGGMMKHLALVESSWLDDDFMGRGLMPPFASVDWDADRDWEWHTPRTTPQKSCSPLFGEAVRRADAVLDEALATNGVGLDGLSVASCRLRAVAVQAETAEQDEAAAERPCSVLQHDQNRRELEIIVACL